MQTDLDIQIFNTCQTFKCELLIEVILGYLKNHCKLNIEREELEERLKELSSFGCFTLTPLGYHLNCDNLELFLETILKHQAQQSSSANIDMSVGVNLLKEIAQTNIALLDAVNNLVKTVNEMNERLNCHSSPSPSEVKKEVEEENEDEEEPTIVKVQSSSKTGIGTGSTGTFYDVDYQYGTCSCPDFQYRKPHCCKHISEVINNHTKYGLTQRDQVKLATIKYPSSNN